MSDTRPIKGAAQDIFTFARFNQLTVGPFSGVLHQAEAGMMTSNAFALEMDRIAQQYVQNIPQAMASLEEAIKNVDPCILLTVLNTFALINPIDHDPEIEEVDPILQHHVELLQAMVLRYPQDVYSASATFDGDEMRSLLNQVTWGLAFRKSDSHSNVTSQSALPTWTSDQMRWLSLTVRNWGTLDQVIRIIPGIFARIDDEVQQQCGFQVAKLVEMCMNLLRLFSRRLEEHVVHLGQFVSAETAEQVVSAFCDAFPVPSIVHEHLNHLANDASVGLDVIREVVAALSYTIMPSLYAFDLDTALDAYPGVVARETLASALGKWSWSFGDLRDQTVESLYFDNPVHQRPLISFTPEAYLWPITGLFASYGLEMMENVALTTDRLRKKYADESRAKYLEAEVYRLFTHAFPDAVVLKGAKWTLPGTRDECETDIVVILDSTIVVVEAKSGRLTAPARRGAMPRLRRDVEKLIASAAMQSHRFVQSAHNAVDPIKLRTAHGAGYEVDPLKVHQTLRITVTLDDFGPLSAYWGHLVEAKLVGEDVQPAPTMTLTCLEHIFDVLEGPTQILHYLVKRSNLEAHYSYLADELDLLAGYVLRNLDFDDVGQSDNAHINMYGASKMLDPWMMRRHLTDPVQRPKRALTAWWSTLIARIEGERFARWTEAGVIFWNANIDEQRAFETACREGIRRIKRDPHKRAIGTLNYLLPKNAEGNIIVAVMYKGLDRRQLKAKVRPYIQQLKGTKLDVVVVLGVDVKASDKLVQDVWCE